MTFRPIFEGAIVNEHSIYAAADPGFGEGVCQGVLGTVVSQWDPGAKSLVGVKGQSTSKTGVCGWSPQKPI